MNALDASSVQPQWFQGEHFDFVLNIEVEHESGTHYLALPYNFSDDPWIATTHFVQKNGIPPELFETVHRKLLRYIDLALNHKQQRHNVFQHPPTPVPTQSFTAPILQSQVDRVRDNGLYNNNQGSRKSQNAWLQPNRQQISEGNEELTYYHQQRERQQDIDEAYYSLTGSRPSPTPYGRQLVLNREGASKWRKVEPSHLRAHGRPVSQRLASTNKPLTALPVDHSHTLPQSHGPSGAGRDAAFKIPNGLGHQPQRLAQHSLGQGHVAPTPSIIDLTHSVIDLTGSESDEEERVQHRGPHTFYKGVAFHPQRTFQPGTPADYAEALTLPAARCIPCWISDVYECLANDVTIQDLNSGKAQAIHACNTFANAAYRSEGQSPVQVVQESWIKADKAQIRVNKILEAEELQENGIRDSFSKPADQEPELGTCRLYLLKQKGIGPYPVEPDVIWCFDLIHHDLRRHGVTVDASGQ